MRIASLVLAGILLSLTVAGCGRPSGERPDLGPALSDAAYAASPGGTVDLAAVAPFDWQRVSVFETCLDPDVVDKTLGFHFDTSDLRNGEFCNDMEVGRPLLVLTKDQDVVAWVILNADRRRAVFFDTNPGGSLTVDRAQATFVVRDGGAEERDLGTVP